MDRRIFRFLAVLGSVVVGAAALPAAAADPAPHGRVSYEAGGGMVKGAGDSDWSYATVNTLVLRGDTLWADAGALLELEMQGGSFLRMADRSKAEIVSLPPSAVIRVWTGSFYAQRTARSTGEYIVQTPSAALAIDKDTHARIDVVDSGATTVSVRWGRVTVNTEAGSPAVVMAGLRVYIDPGFLPSTPAAFDTGLEDDFDAWSRERAEFLAVGPDVIPSSYRVTEPPIGVADLARYGSWVTVDNTPYWRPSPTVAVDYVPYRSGLWSYVPAYGHVWVGEQPFSYVTSHYGRWYHDSSYGWLWTYRNVWSPAWVAAVRCGPNFIWTPLDPFDRPCHLGGYPYYRHGYGYGRYPYGHGGHGYGYGYGGSGLSAIWDFGSFVFSVAASSYLPVDRLFSGYGYPFPGRRDSVNVVTGDVEIWNIVGNTIDIDLPWVGDSRFPVANYTPNRILRGVDRLVVGQRAVRAADRISRLEQSVGRARFATVDRTGGRLERTGLRNADVRRVVADTARRSEGRSLAERIPRDIRNADAAGRDWSRSVTRVASNDSRGVRGEREAARTRSAGRDADISRTPDARTVRTRDGVETGSSRGNAVDTARTAREPRNVDLDRSTARDDARTSRARSPEQTEAPDRRVDAGRTTRTAGRTDAEAAPRGRDKEPRTISLPGHGGTEARTSGRGGPSEQPRTASREPESASSRTSRAESARTDTARSTGPDRTPERGGPSVGSRSAAGRSEAVRTPSRGQARDSVRTITLPDRSGSDRAQARGSSERERMTERTPSAATAPPSRSATRPESQPVTRTAPQVSGRSSGGRDAAAPRVTLPPSRTSRSTSVSSPPSARTQTPRMQAPQRRSEAPRVQAPQRREAPRIQTPQRREAPRVQVPQRRETPRVQAPQHRSEAPRVQAPQRRSEAPRVQAPQRREEPRVQAPQRRSEAPQTQSRENRSRGGDRRTSSDRQGRGR